MMRRPHPACRRHRSPRQGAILVVALVCLLVVASLVAAMFEASLRNRRQLRSERDRRQTELFVQAGIDRAAYRLSQDNQYRGENWSPTTTLPDLQAELTIRILAPDDDHDWQLHVVAEYPLGGPHSIRRSQTLALPHGMTLNLE